MARVVRAARSAERGARARGTFIPWERQRKFWLCALYPSARPAKRSFSDTQKRSHSVSLLLERKRADFSLGIDADPLSLGPVEMDTTALRDARAGAGDVDTPGLADRFFRKAETAVLNRTSRILCVIERCTDEHNYSAVLRTAEALGVQHVWLVDPVVSSNDNDGVEVMAKDDVGDDTNETSAKDGVNKGKGGGVGAKRKKSQGHGNDWREQHKLFARRAQEFTTIREFPTAEACVAALRADGRKIWATDLSQHAVPLTEQALRDATGGDESNDESDGGAKKNKSVVPERLAIVFGTESVGVTSTMLNASDRRVYLPLRGFADSLNLSVAAALCLHELFKLCPEAVGAMAEDERQGLREKWFTQLAAGRALTKSEDKRLKLVELTLTRRDGGAPTKPGEESTDALKREAEVLVVKRARLAAETARTFLENKTRLTPLRDMRRSDEHRGAFVGKKTRAKNEHLWAGMPAVGGTGGE